MALSLFRGEELARVFDGGFGGCDRIELSGGLIFHLEMVRKNWCGVFLEMFSNDDGSLLTSLCWSLANALGG